MLATYAEVFIPLISDANSRTGLQRLEVSLAARYEDYSDFGNTMNPKVGLLWSPAQSLAVRGTIGTSYRAPALADLDDSDPRVNQYFYAPEIPGLTPFPLLLQDGFNSSLQAEEATTWTAGFQWSPKRANGLALEITYFNVDFEDRIERPTFNVLAILDDPRFASIINANPTDEEIAAVVNNRLYDPTVLAFLGGPFPAADILAGTFPVEVIVDNRLTNLAQSVVTGAEVQMSYDFETALGSFNLGFTGSYLFDFERKFIEADPLMEEVDTLGRPVDFRARSSATWGRNGWVVTGFVNYTDGYIDQFSNPARAVDSWTTVDLTIAYNNAGEGNTLLSSTRLSLSAQNLLDEDPPFVDTIGGVGYDAANANPLGRFVSLQITKDW